MLRVGCFGGRLKLIKLAKRETKENKGKDARKCAADHCGGERAGLHVHVLAERGDDNFVAMLEQKRVAFHAVRHVAAAYKLIKLIRCGCNAPKVKECLLLPADARNDNDVELGEKLVEQLMVA